MKKSLLKAYAKLIVRVGANVQKKQEVVISASVDDSYFVKYVVEEAYKAGASLVEVNWNMQDLTLLNYKYATVEKLSEIPNWKKEKLEHRVNVLPAMIHITSEDPDGLALIDQGKLLAVQKNTGPTIIKYQDRMDNKYQWTIAGIPSEKWACKVFPNASKKKAIELLWELILKVSRAYEGNPILNWKEHNANLDSKKAYLNNLQIKKLTYKSSNGTDFSIMLPKDIEFHAGGDYTLNKVFYNPNIPTEECFTSPIKDSCNGVVYSTKPLSVRGVLVDNFGFRFENGQVVEVICQNPTYKDVLEKLVSTDDGAKMLGEVALVPYDSPINQTNTLFYNTLYDENACCHLALGRAFEECIRGYANKTKEQIEAIDLNKSMIHVDFMIGSSDLSIVAETYDGKIVQIFKDGVWAI
ncbi:TPA: aminopeptidase [Candidatus Avacholeplasma faecigallinarum]|nr:aminopeptidase [Candidatus Avacholeplasma faecigallinarum]